MINLNFGLWHSGGKLSYLRYLTFKTLRHFHPHSRIQLYYSKKFTTNGENKNQEFFSQNSVSKDYFGELKKIDVEIVRFDYLGKYDPNFQSDVFRYFFLKNHGGFYLDTDQIILKSFKDLPLNKYEFIYSCYQVVSSYTFDNMFCPVGVLGADKDSKIIEYINRELEKYYRVNDYNSIGPWMMLDIVNKVNMSKAFNAPSHYFYPVPICDYVNSICDGSLKINKDNFALHWFGGCDRINKFKNKYTEEFAKTSNDTISKFLREKRLI